MTTPTRAPAFPDFRQGDQITNPTLFALARQRWPGVPISAAMLADAAALTDQPLYVLATDQAIAAGLAAITDDRRRHAAAAATERSYSRMNFDPAADYHKGDKS